MTELECGHPGGPSNLVDGKCGTCACANKWDEVADLTESPVVKSAAKSIANSFRKGSMIFDTNGKTIIENFF